VIAAGAMLSFFAFKQTSDPRYEGKALSGWLRLADKANPKSSERAKAEEAIRAIGTNALPLLLKWTAAEPNGVQDNFESIAKRIVGAKRAGEWSATLFGKQAGAKHELAGKGFEILREQAAPAIRRLSEMAKKRGNPFALFMLAKIGKSGLPRILDVLGDATDENRYVAVDCVSILQSSGVDCSVALPTLLECLTGTNHLVAMCAVGALESFTNYPDIVIPGVFNRIQSIPDPEIRLGIIGRLGEFGGRGQSAVPQLIAFLHCTNADFCTNNDFRRAVLHSLRKISPEDVPQEWVTNSIPTDDSGAGSSRRHHLW
jgi:hypothetical protein